MRTCPLDHVHGALARAGARVVEEGHPRRRDVLRLEEDGDRRHVLDGGRREGGVLVVEAGVVLDLACDLKS